MNQQKVLGFHLLVAVPENGYEVTLDLHYVVDVPCVFESGHVGLVLGPSLAGDRPHIDETYAFRWVAQ